MIRCPYCDAATRDEGTTVVRSSDGPVLLTRWRCRSDPNHWWSSSTDAPGPPPPRSAGRPAEMVAALRSMNDGRPEAV